MHKYLCQNCLFVVESDDWEHFHIGDGSCPKCGGDMCGCPDCLAHINSCQACIELSTCKERGLCSSCENLNPCVFEIE